VKEDGSWCEAGIGRRRRAVDGGCSARSIPGLLRMVRLLALGSDGDEAVAGAVGCAARVPAVGR